MPITIVVFNDEEFSDDKGALIAQDIRENAEELTKDVNVIVTNTTSGGGENQQ